MDICIHDTPLLVWIQRGLPPQFIYFTAFTTRRFEPTIEKVRSDRAVPF